MRFINVRHAKLLIRSNVTECNYGGIAVAVPARIALGLSSCIGGAAVIHAALQRIQSGALTACIPQLSEGIQERTCSYCSVT